MENSYDNLETRLPRRRKKSGKSVLVGYALVAAISAYGGDYGRIISRTISVVHTVAGVRDAPLSANPFDYEISYEMLPGRERFAFVENTVTGEKHRLYENGKTEPDIGIIESFIERMKSSYHWAKNTEVARRLDELTRELSDLFTSKKDKGD